MQRTNTQTMRKKREPLFHVIKRVDVPGWQKILIRIGALIVGLMIAYFFLFVAANGNVESLQQTWDRSTQINDYETLYELETNYALHIDSNGQLLSARISFVGFWKNLLKGAFGIGATTVKDGVTVTNWQVVLDNTLNTLRELSLLLMIGLALLPSFKMKFWNLGADGQVLMGDLAAVIWMYYLSQNPAFNNKDWLIILLMIVSSILAGIIWAVIPAIFKAFFNTNESLFTLMMNYIAMAIVSIFLSIAVKNQTQTMNIIDRAHLWQPFGNQYLLPIFTCILVFIFIYIYLRFTKHGYELEVVGESQNTAKYVGINVKKVIIRTLVLSGAICGLVGLLFAGSINYSINPNATASRGFTAIMVTWLGQFNPVFMIFTAFIVAFLNKGMANGVQVTYGLTNDAFSNISLGLVYFCIIACEFFISYKIVRINHVSHESSKKVELLTEDLLPKQETAAGGNQ